MFISGPIWIPDLILTLTMDSNPHTNLVLSKLLHVHPSNTEATFDQSTRTQRILKTPIKPCYIGIHYIDLAECSQMSTHVPGLQSFSMFLHRFVLAKLGIRSIMVNPLMLKSYS